MSTEYRNQGAVTPCILLLIYAIHQTNLEMVAVIVVVEAVPVVADLWRRRGGRRRRRLLPHRARLGLRQPLRLPELGAPILKPDLCESGTGQLSDICIL